jgi:hypothetical protein
VNERISDEPKTLAAGNQGQVEESPASTKKDDVSQINLGSIQRRMAVAKDRKDKNKSGGKRKASAPT